MPRADNLATIMCSLYREPESLKFLVPKGPVQACIGTAKPLLDASTEAGLEVNAKYMFMFFEQNAGQNHKMYSNVRVLQGD